MNEEIKKLFNEALKKPQEQEKMNYIPFILDEMDVLNDEAKEKYRKEYLSIIGEK